VAAADKSLAESHLPSGLVSTQSGDAEVVAISAAYTHASALLRNGTLVAWKTILLGGMPDEVHSLAVPERVQGNAASAIAFGGVHNAVVLNGGAVDVWLDDEWQNSTFYAATAQVPKNVMSANVTAVATGWAHTLALTAGGAVLAWGPPWEADDHGQAAVPQAAATGVLAIAAAFNTSMAVTEQGSVFLWGQLGAEAGGSFAAAGNATGFAGNGSVCEVRPSNASAKIVAAAAGAGSDVWELLLDSGRRVQIESGDEVGCAAIQRLIDNENGTTPSVGGAGAVVAGGDSNGGGQQGSAVPQVVMVAAGSTHAAELLDDNVTVHVFGVYVTGASQPGAVNGTRFDQQLVQPSPVLELAVGHLFTLALLGSSDAGANGSSGTTTGPEKKVLTDGELRFMG
jgi:hypothetical protein